MAISFAPGSRKTTLASIGNAGGFLKSKYAYTANPLPQSPVPVRTNYAWPGFGDLSGDFAALITKLRAQR